MHKPQIIGIYITATKGDAMQSKERVSAAQDLGLVGDRYHGQSGTIKKGPRDVTLIEQESLEALKRDYQIELLPHETRRNLLTQNVPLNHLVNKEFNVGDVKMRGIELCEPCGYLERLSGKTVKQALAHRGGLRAQILSDGEIKVGDSIQF